MSEEQKLIIAQLKDWYKVSNYRKSDTIFYIKSFQHGEIGYFVGSDEIIFAKEINKNQPNGLQWLKDNLLSEVDPRDTRIAELEQCIRENYEALRDKAVEVKYNEMTKHGIFEVTALANLSIQEQSFMLKAESLIPTLKK